MVGMEDIERNYCKQIALFEYVWFMFLLFIFNPLIPTVNTCNLFIHFNSLSFNIYDLLVSDVVFSTI